MMNNLLTRQCALNMIDEILAIPNWKLERCGDEIASPVQRKWFRRYISTKDLDNARITSFHKVPAGFYISFAVIKSPAKGTYTEYDFFISNKKVK